MTKIFGLSLKKSGTTYIYKHLKYNGISSVHGGHIFYWKKKVKFNRDANIFCGDRINNIDFILKTFPDAYFIVIVRPFIKWINSVVNYHIILCKKRNIDVDDKFIIETITQMILYRNEIYEKLEGYKIKNILIANVDNNNNVIEDISNFVGRRINKRNLKRNQRGHNYVDTDKFDQYLMKCFDVLDIDHSELNSDRKIYSRSGNTLKYTQEQLDELEKIPIDFILGF